MSSFGDCVRALRHAAGLTMEQLAEASGVSARAISDMERGQSRAPRARTLAALADGLGLDTDGRAGLEAAAKEARSPSAAGRPRMGELPRGVVDFVGRATELATASAVARQAGNGEGPPPVLVVHGPPGLGKTALAVRIADELHDSFPDDRLYLDLRGTDVDPLSVGEALQRLLRALGMDQRRIAHTDDERSAQLRAVLRERPCLLVLDNAGSEAQVRPLLPASGECMVVVTSRRALGGLEGVLRIGLTPLAPAESASMLGMIATQAADPAAVEQVDTVARMCGHLPLALRIAGTRLASRPQWTVGNLVDRLTDADRRLAALTAGDTGVGAAFALSHAQLSAPAAVLFRRLGHVSGVDFAAPLAAVLTETGLPDVEDRLDELVELGLLQPVGVDRYQFHDLIRLYAEERLRAEESAARAATERRMNDWLLQTAIVAGRWYEPGYGSLPDGWDGLVPLATREEAGAWLRAETDNWLAALRATAAEGQHQLVADVSEALKQYSDASYRWPGWYEVYGLSRAAAAALPDLRQRVEHLNNYAYAALQSARRFDEAAEVAIEAYQLAETLAYHEEQVQALQAIASAWRLSGRLEESLRAYGRARDLADQIADHDAYVAQFYGIGVALIRLNRSAEAIDEFRVALAEVDRRPLSPLRVLLVRAAALSGMAMACGMLGRWSESQHLAELALPLATEHGEPGLMGEIHVSMGRARAALGRTAEGRANLTRGLELIAPDMWYAPFARKTLSSLDD
ncbi:hypothetical protein Raf01_87360 [Rugosimonospora africana]|uniref:HTH cro/C1-type domain-containing protein n=2 Tax=Rugosimonospora africana TaxID=556532 RepID=A0A8J3R2G5_9ACTN|nr:hypothetical protein Raf01_87360 [Rugosimonospora africana]